MTDSVQNIQTTAEIAHHAAPAWKIEARALTRLAGPIVVTQLAQMGVGTIDVLMLGAYSKDALAASALALSIYWAMWLLGMGPAVAVQPMIAHTLGEKRFAAPSVRASVRMALWAIIFISPPMMLLLYFTGDILVLLGEPEKLSADAGAFMHILMFGLPFTLAFNVLRGYTNALSHPRAALVVMMLTVLVNASLAYALIFGHFGAPRMGLLGAGLASAVSFAFSFFALLAAILLTPSLSSYRIFHRFARPAWPKFAEIVRLGLPIGMTMIFEAMFFNAGTLIMGYFGTASVAAHQVALNAVALAFMVPLGVATAATVRVGLAAGAKDLPRVRLAGLTASALGQLFMLVTGFAFAVFPREIVGFYIDAKDPANADVIEHAVVFLRLGAAFQFFDSLQVTLSLSLRGLKDAQAPMWINGASYWLVGFPAALLFVFVFGFEGVGVWMAFILGLFCCASGMVLRFAWMSGMIGSRTL
ncbi:MATE family efflux transporter [Parvibaculum sp.]|uniref:MATE family efflux transporter n=1 Tax=Parvibaculum sp. TaxID=2024848 RepID=UPI003210E557